jgi:hypothetical protein
LWESLRDSRNPLSHYKKSQNSTLLSSHFLAGVSPKTFVEVRPVTAVRRIRRIHSSQSGLWAHRFSLLSRHIRGNSLKSFPIISAISPLNRHIASRKQPPLESPWKGCERCPSTRYRAGRELSPGSALTSTLAGFFIARRRFDSLPRKLHCEKRDAALPEMIKRLVGNNRWRYQNLNTDSHHHKGSKMGE